MRGDVIGSAIGLAVLTIALIGWVRSDIANVRADVSAAVTAIRSEAAADRRALQAAMDTFRLEMQRLAERQAHVEGQLSLIVETPPSRGEGSAE